MVCSSRRTSTYWIILESIPHRHAQNKYKDRYTLKLKTDPEPENRPKELGFPEIFPHPDTELHTWQKPQKEIY